MSEQNHKAFGTNLLEQNNDHTQILYEIEFLASLMEIHTSSNLKVAQEMEIITYQTVQKRARLLMKVITR